MLCCHAWGSGCDSVRDLEVPATPDYNRNFRTGMSEKGTTAMDGGFVPLSYDSGIANPECMELLIPDSGINRCPMRDSTPHPQKKNNNIKKRIIIVKKENTHETTT